jgi:uncharacterized protein Yka (UPF0111/DUF47 family)
MFSLQKLFGKDEKFFDLLESSAEQGCQSVKALIHLLKHKEDGDASLEEFIATRRKDKNITEEITTLLCRSFVTPLEREDIEALAAALYKIPKTIEKFGERLLISRQHLGNEDFSKQVAVLEMATNTLLEMVASLRKHANVVVMNELNRNMQRLEGEADKLMLDLLKELYSGKYEPLVVIILRNLYELLEKVIDRCRDAGNVVFHIVLKYS